MMYSCIYLLTNTINQKQYVGFTSKTLSERCDKHINSARNGSKYYIHNSIRKYGWAVFTSKILYMSKDARHCKNEAEVALIASYNTFIGRGYNLTAGGDGCVGYKHSTETKLKISVAHKGKVASTETKLKMSVSSKGNKSALGLIHSTETKLKMSVSSKGPNYKLRGHKHSIESKVKMSESSIKHKIPHHGHLNDMYKFFTHRQTAKFYGVSISTITKWNLKLIK